MFTILKSILKLLSRIIPDKIYLKCIFKARLGYGLSFKNPKSFNEKINWLKIYDRKEIYVSMVDKFESKKIVANLIGEEHIVKNYGIWDSFDSIDMNLLPDKFVLKCTHDSGGLVICKTKKEFDINRAKRIISSSIKKNYFYGCREWPYKKVKPRIIAEELLENMDGTELIDYKFFCFNGEPKFLYISKGLDNHKTAQISFLNIDWSFAPFKRIDYENFRTLPQKPSKYKEMIEISKKLSKGIPFLRVDLYCVNNKVYFSELTFSPCGGFVPFNDTKYDFDLGKLLVLEKNNG